MRVTALLLSFVILIHIFGCSGGVNASYETSRDNLSMFSYHICCNTSLEPRCYENFGCESGYIAFSTVFDEWISRLEMDVNLIYPTIEAILNSTTALNYTYYIENAATNDTSISSQKLWMTLMSVWPYCSENYILDPSGACVCKPGMKCHVTYSDMTRMGSFTVTITIVVVLFTMLSMLFMCVKLMDN